MNQHLHHLLPAPSLAGAAFRVPAAASERQLTAVEERQFKIWRRERKAEKEARVATCSGTSSAMLLCQKSQLYMCYCVLCRHMYMHMLSTATLAANGFPLNMAVNSWTEERRTNADLSCSLPIARSRRVCWRDNGMTYVKIFKEGKWKRKKIEEN